MLRVLIGFSQHLTGSQLTFRIEIASNFDSVDTLKIAHFAGHESAFVVSAPNITLVHRHIVESAFGIELTVIVPGDHHGVMIHENDLDLPLTIDPDTPQPDISAHE